ncbi:MAG: hypothetical protein R2712_22435 [Vicinamibacterales bacterium]
MRSIRITAWVGVVALVVMAAAPAAQGVNVTGTWVLDVQTSGGGGQPTLTLKQDGEKPTGTTAARRWARPMSPAR